MKIDIVLPSYNRIEKLRKCLESIIESKKELLSKDSANIYIYFSRQEDMNNIMNYILPSQTLQYIIYEKSFKHSEFWNDHFKIMKSDALCFLNDDTELLSDCLKSAIPFLYQYNTDCVVGFNQINCGGDPLTCSSAFGLIGKVFADRFPERKVFCPDYNCLYVDEELGKFAKDINKFVYCKEAQLNHWHPAWTKEKPDDTHLYNKINKPKDIKIYKLRQQKGLLWGKSFETISHLIEENFL